MEDRELLERIAVGLDALPKVAQSLDALRAKLEGGEKKEKEVPAAVPAAPPMRQFAEGEFVFLKASVVKTHDDSNHVVVCAEERFTPSRAALESAEVGVDDLAELETLCEQLREKRDEQRRQSIQQAQTAPTAAPQA